MRLKSPSPSSPTSAAGASEPPRTLAQLFAKSTALKVAVVITFIGAAMWTYAAVTRPSAQPSTTARATDGSSTPSAPRSGTGLSGGANNLTHGFAPGGTGTGAGDGEAGAPDLEEDADETEDQARRLIDRVSPALTRFGLSFTVGFFLAWGLRAFFKITLLIAVVLGGLTFAVNQLGIIDLDVAFLRSRVDEGLSWLETHAGTFKDFILGHIPSATAAVLGAFFGLRVR